MPDPWSRDRIWHQYAAKKVANNHRAEEKTPTPWWWLGHGIKLGNPNGARALQGKQVGNKEAVAAVKQKAQEHASNLRAIVEDIRAQGITSIRKIAEELNNRAILAPRGGEWQPTTVVRLLARLEVSP
jgi:hypothetical protein